MKLEFKKRDYGYAVFGDINMWGYEEVIRVARIKYNQLHKVYTLQTHWFIHYDQETIEQIGEFMKKINKEEK